MEIIGAAALIAVGIVVAAILYGRTHGASSAGADRDAATATALQAALTERSAALERREEALERRESELTAQRVRNRRREVQAGAQPASAALSAWPGEYGHSSKARQRPSASRSMIHRSR